MGVGISCIFGLSLLVGRPREMCNKLKTSYPMKVERETKKMASKIVEKRRLTQETTGFLCVPVDSDLPVASWPSMCVFRMV